MQKHYNYLDIDLDKKIHTKLKAKQGDSKSRYILVNLISNSTYYDLSDCSVKIYGIKKDKTIFFNHANVINGKLGQFEIELTTQALAVTGEIEIQILILGTNDEKLTTFSFFIDVEKTIVDDAAIESTNEFTALTTSLSKLVEWNGYFAETSGKIEEKYTERLNGVDNEINEMKTLQKLDSTGYKILPGGLIIQWGRFNVPAGEFNGYTGAIATLPITFPNEILNVSGTLSHSVESEKYIVSDLSIAADTTSNSQIGFRYKHTGNFLAGGIQINYIAIGR